VIAARYSGIISTTSTSCWASDQIAKLNNYQVEFLVKLVVLYTSPSGENGVILTPAHRPDELAILSFADTFPRSFRKGLSDITIPTTDIFVYVYARYCVSSLILPQVCRCHIKSLIGYPCFANYVWLSTLCCRSVHKES
jgi:hypothetical protein